MAQAELGGRDKEFIFNAQCKLETPSPNKRTRRHTNTRVPHLQALAHDQLPVLSLQSSKMMYLFSKSTAVGVS